MKVDEGILANRIRQQLGVGEILFRFTKGKGMKETDNNNNYYY